MNRNAVGDSEDCRFLHFCLGGLRDHSRPDHGANLHRVLHRFSPGCVPHYRSNALGYWMGNHCHLVDGSLSRFGFGICLSTWQSPQNWVAQTGIAGIRFVSCDGWMRYFGRQSGLCGNGITVVASGTNGSNSKCFLYVPVRPQCQLLLWCAGGNGADNVVFVPAILEAFATGNTWRHLVDGMLGAEWIPHTKVPEPEH